MKVFGVMLNITVKCISRLGSINVCVMKFRREDDDDVVRTGYKRALTQATDGEGTSLAAFTLYAHCIFFACKSDHMSIIIHL